VILRTIETMDLWLVAALLSDRSAASLYGIAYALARFPLVIAHGLGDAVFPRVSSALSANDPQGARQAAARALRVLLAVFTLACCVTAGAAGEFIILLFGAKYAAAAPVLVVLAPGILLSSCAHLSLRLVSATNKPAWSTAIVAGMLLLDGGLCVVLIPAWGILGAALASLITFGAGAVASVWTACRRLGTVVAPATLVRCAIAGAGVFAVARLWQTPGPLVLLKAAVLAALFVAAMVAMGEVTGVEARQIRLGLFALPARSQERT